MVKTSDEAIQASLDELAQAASEYKALLEAWRADPTDELSAHLEVQVGVLAVKAQVLQEALEQEWHD